MEYVKLRLRLPRKSCISQKMCLETLRREDRTGDAPGGHESGHKCQPEIVGAVWMDAYEQTPIVDNGDLDPADRARVQTYAGEFSELTDEEQAEALASPQGIPTTTTLSFLICKYGGLIEPYNSGQQYDPDEPLD